MLTITTCLLVDGLYLVLIYLKTLAQQSTMYEELQNMPSLFYRIVYYFALMNIAFIGELWLNISSAYFQWLALPIIVQHLMKYEWIQEKVERFQMFIENFAITVVARMFHIILKHLIQELKLYVGITPSETEIVSYFYSVEPAKIKKFVHNLFSGVIMNYIMTRLDWFQYPFQQPLPATTANETIVSTPAQTQVIGQIIASRNWMRLSEYQYVHMLFQLLTKRRPFGKSILERMERFLWQRYIEVQVYWAWFLFLDDSWMKWLCFLTILWWNPAKQICWPNWTHFHPKIKRSVMDIYSFYQTKQCSHMNLTSIISLLFCIVCIAMNRNLMASIIAVNMDAVSHLLLISWNFLMDRVRQKNFREFRIHQYFFFQCVGILLVLSSFARMFYKSWTWKTLFVYIGLFLFILFWKVLFFIFNQQPLSQLSDIQDDYFKLE